MDMMQKKGLAKKGTPEFIIAIALFSAPLFITPWVSFDPINIPRLTLLGMLATWSLAYLLLAQKPNPIQREFKGLFLLVGGMALSLIFSFFFSGASLTMQFYGAQGRNAGLLTYMSLLLLLLIATQVRSSLIKAPMNSALYVTSVINLGYGLVQLLGLDPVKWQNNYTPVVGTFGNPNFFAAFLAITSIFLISQLIYSVKSNYKKSFFDCLLLALSLYLQIETSSIQGVLMIFIGTFLILFMKFRVQRFRKFSYLVLMSFLIFGIALFISFLGKGPFGSQFFQTTLRLRTFFWEAAVRMGLERPWTGFGIDSFGAWYRTYRTEESVNQFAEGIITDSAHSIFFDILSGAGFVPLLFYILIQILILRKALRLMLNSDSIERELGFLIASWIAFLAQSTISVNSLGLSTIGFCLGGLVLSRSTSTGQVSFTNRLKSKRFIELIGATSGLLIALPMFLSDARFRYVVSQPDGQKMIAFTNSWPVNDFQVLVIAKLFYSSGYLDLGREKSYQALRINPRNVNALLTLLDDKELKKSERVLVINQLQSIDPISKSFAELRA